MPADTLNFHILQNIHNRNDKSEPVPHLEDSVRITIDCHVLIKKRRSRNRPRRNGCGFFSFSLVRFLKNRRHNPNPQGDIDLVTYSNKT